MIDAGRIIHHAIRIDRDTELLLQKTPPDAVGKARPHKQHLLEGGNVERRSGYIDNGPKLHDNENDDE